MLLSYQFDSDNINNVLVNQVLVLQLSQLYTEFQADI